MNKTETAANISSYTGAEKNGTIIIIRVVSMLMIIFCHLSSWLGIKFLAMMLNVGIYAFLLISGTLYAPKQIDKAGVFIKQRWLKLCVPMYCLALFLLIYNAFSSNIGAFRSIPTYLFNIQGLGVVIYGVELPQMTGLGPLWFLTVIMMCYILLLGIKKLEAYQRWEDSRIIFVVLAVLSVLYIVFTYTVGVQLYYFLTFFIGYAIGKHNVNLSRRDYAFATLAMLCAMIIRIVFHGFLDNTITYNDVVVPVTHVVLALWICMTVQFISQKYPNTVRNLAQGKFMKKLEGLSMYLYMTHYMFLMGPFYVSAISHSKAVQLLAFFAATTISAMVLQYVSEKALRLMLRISRARKPMPQ